MKPVIGEATRMATALKARMRVTRKMFGSREYAKSGLPRF
jgi:hypothetical protein